MPACGLSTARSRAAMSILITGASGFIGGHLAQRLVRDGEKVTVLVRAQSDLSNLTAVADDIEVAVHDGSTAGLRTIVEVCRPDLAFHVASLFVSEHKLEEVAPLVTSNVLFPCQLAEALSDLGTGNLVNVGTSWQHFENRDYSPVCLYAATKEAFEALLRFYVETDRLKVVTLKLFDTYGLDDPRPKLFSLLRRLAESGESLGMSPGEQLQDLVYVDDVVEALVMAGQRLRQGQVTDSEVYAVSSGAPIPLKDLVAAFAKAAGRSLDIEWGGRPYRNREVMVPWSRGERLPGWQPRVDIEDGLQRMLAADV